MDFKLDMSAMPPGVVEEFRKGRVARETLALLKAPGHQAEHARQFEGEHRSIEGIGRLRMVVDADSFHAWGREFSYDSQGRYIGDGYKCWSDKTWLREFERDNEAVRVKCGGTKTQVGWCGSGKKFSKAYEWKPQTSKTF